MTTETATSADYADALARLNGRATRKLANNTYARLEDDGRVVIRYHATDILTYYPTGEVEYQSGGWLTYTTKDRFNAFGARGVRIYSERGHWLVNLWGNGPASDYYDGLTVRDGAVLAPRHAGDLDKAIKRAIDRYVKRYDDETLARLVERADEQGTAGDCWYCAMHTTDTGRPLGEVTGDHEHLREHVRHGYVMASLAYNAVQAAGYRVPAVILRHGDMTRRAIRKYLRQRLATHTMGAQGCES